MNTKPKRNYGEVRTGRDASAGTNESVFDKFFSEPPSKSKPLTISEPVQEITPVEIQTPSEVTPSKSEPNKLKALKESTHTQVAPICTLSGWNILPGTMRARPSTGKVTVSERTRGGTKSSGVWYEGRVSSLSQIWTC